MKTEEKQKCMVLIEDWQMQCCGTPFKNGDNIEWTVVKWTETLEDHLLDVDYCYENHGGNGEDLLKITGLVKDIKALYYRREAQHDSGIKIFKMIYEKTVDVIEANGWEKNKGDLEFGNYVVILHNYSIQSYSL
jgi:hypothetical protein